jgi:hypothetical protein
VFQDICNRKITIRGAGELLVTRYGSHGPQLEGLRSAGFELEPSFPISLQIEKLLSLRIAEDNIDAKIYFRPAILSIL